MSMRNILDGQSNKATPQSSPIPGREAEMSKNHAGGFTFNVGPWAMLDRFLMLGTEGGTYYMNQKKHTTENLINLRACIAQDGVKVVNRIVEISDSGRAPKNTPAIIALALAAKIGNADTKRAAYDALPKVVRIGTHLFEYAEAIKTFGGFSSGWQNAVTKWYTSRSAQSLALQLVKYKQREGWSHRDILRLAKPGAARRRSVRPAHIDAAFDYVTKGVVPRDVTGLELITVSEQLSSMDAPGVCAAIRQYNLPREVIPTHHLNDVAVWEAMLDAGMPYTAMLRNLSKMSSIGVLKNNYERLVVNALKNAEHIKAARVHPIAILVALKTYQQGHGTLGSLVWSVNSRIVDALDDAFYKAFGNLKKTNERWLVALDVSGSMESSVSGIRNLSCRDASAAISMVLAHQANCEFIGFTSGGFGRPTVQGTTVLDISPRRRLDDNIRTISNLPFGGTDCALPMLWAQENGKQFDKFIIFTDNETWAGSIQPSQALKQYRAKMASPNAKLIVSAMSSTGLTIADPADPLQLDVVGFDAILPELVANF